MSKKLTSRKLNSHQKGENQNPFAPRPFAPSPTPQVQAKSEQTKPDLTETRERIPRGDRLSRIEITPPNPIQPKLTIGAPNDRYEREADTVARKVVSEMNSVQLRAPAIQPKIVGDSIQPKISIRPKSMVQRSETEASSELESSIQRSRSSGQALSENVREPMERAFGADFTGVRIHTNSESDRLNHSIQAKAFTTGQDIFFRQGEYQPSSRGGQELLAHELTHVVQQKQDVVQRKTSTVIKPLSSDIVGSQLIGKSTTEKINDLVEKYNKIEGDNTNYQSQLDLLLEISNLIGKWNSKYSSGKDQKVNKMQQIEDLAVQVETELVQVQNQQKGLGQDKTSSLSNSSQDVEDNQPVVESLNPVEEKKSNLSKDKTIKRGQGVIAAICKEQGKTGGHAWVAFEYITKGGEAKNVVMHLTARGGKGDSGSGGSGGSGSSDHREVKHLGSVDSGTVSNENDSGSIIYSGPTNSNSGSGEPETFGGSITINIDSAAQDSYLQSLAGKISRTWDINDGQAFKALKKGQTMKEGSTQGKYIYAITGRSISPTKTGMNCARFVEEVLNAAGIKATAGLVIKTPSEIATGKKGGLKNSSKKSNKSNSSSNSSKSNSKS